MPRKPAKLPSAAVTTGPDVTDTTVTFRFADPEHALTDGAQSITPKQFADMMKAIKRIAAAVDREV